MLPEFRQQIEQFVNWVRRRNPTAHTWQDYHCDLHQFADTIGNKSLKEISYKEIDSFIEIQINQELKASTINRRLAAVASLYKYYMIEDDELDCPVIKHRHTLRPEQKLPRAVPEDELKKLFAVITDARDTAIFLLMLRCGLRISEDRSVYLSGKTEAAVRNYLAIRPDIDLNAVFINCRNQPLTTMGIQKRLEKYREMAGIYLTAHQLRHNFANDLVLADVPVTSIQKLLGHAWVGTTQIYIAANDPKVKADFFTAIEKLQGWG